MELKEDKFEPLFEPMIRLPSSNNLMTRITGVMGIEFNNYLNYRQSDQKTISMLVGKAVDKNACSVEWGRPATLDSLTIDRPPVDRSSGLYVNRRSVSARDSSMGGSKKKQPPTSSKTTPKTAPTSFGEDELKDDLYLSPSDEEGAPCSPNADGKDAKSSQQDTFCSRSTSGSSDNSKTKNVKKDLAYWMNYSEKLRAPSISNSDGPGTPEDQKSQRDSTHEPNPKDLNIKKEPDEEKESAGNRSTENGGTKYRELVKNGLDSLVGQRPAKRSNLGRMLSGLKDSDDEGGTYEHSSLQKISENAPPAKTSKHANGGRDPIIRHSTPLSPVCNTYAEWKRKGRSQQASGWSERPTSNCFSDRKLTKSPKRELIPYNDLDDENSDLSSDAADRPEKPKILKTEVRSNTPEHKPSLEIKVTPRASPVATHKRRKLDKTAPSLDDDSVASSKRATKSNVSPSKRNRSLKSEPKPEIKKEPFDISLHGFRHDPNVDTFCILFKVPPIPSTTTSPSHRKRKRRHNDNEDKSSKPEKVPPPQCPVQSSSAHSTSDSDLHHDRLAETGGFQVSNTDTDPFDCQSPETDPMVDPNFDRDLSDVESDHEVKVQPSVKRSPSHSGNRHDVGHRSSRANSNDTAPSKGASNRASSTSVDTKQHSSDSVGEDNAHRAPVVASDHKFGHASSTSNQTGHPDLPPTECKREPDIKMSPECRTTRPSSPNRGDRAPLLPSKTASVHDVSSNSHPIKSEPPQLVSESVKPIFSEPSLYKNTLPKIPRKRPSVKTEEPSESKKKRKHSEESAATVPEELPSRDTQKVKESKKNRERKSKKVKTEPEIKREPTTSSSRGRLEITVSDSLEPERSFSPNPTDNAAPFLPPATAEYCEMATQCELMPVVDKDASESGTHTKRMAVAFRIESKSVGTPIGANESRNQPQTPRSSGHGAAPHNPLLGEASSSSSGAARRGSIASNMEDGEPTHAGASEESAEARDAPHRYNRSSNSSENLVEAVLRYRNEQDKLVQNENSAYHCMNSTQCFSEAAAKKHEADRLKNEEPARFAHHALRAGYLFIQACYVEERQNKLENAGMHYRETVHYVRSTSHMIEQVTKVPSNSDLLKSQQAKVRHNFVTLLFAQMKAVLNYRIYWLTHRDTARLRQDVERELTRCGAGVNGASERSTPESLTRSPAAPGGSGASLHLIGEGHHKLMRYLNQTKFLLAAQEYWQHAMLLRTKHGNEMKRLEERVFRRARCECTGPDMPVPCFLRYLNTFLTLHENGEI